ncbi:hypothetical protein BESB_047350 [Besnoitia besnoiti]|uniref:Uncharacterized protein n=1 Tax=Besnoitia besnoiti TaxID=94643 RepID=A0A2A9MLH2_BESBE|nr:hypothetical protein BESB_047350 [Besnoitia besnoiti]PFH36543.1 hypothetical protein BESB_047350 [Besnoitia besnoiti]
MAVPLPVQLQQGELGYRNDSGEASRSGSDSVAWSRDTSDDPQSGAVRGLGRVAPVLRRRVLEEAPAEKNFTKKSTMKRAGAARGAAAAQVAAKSEVFSHMDAVRTCRESSFFFPKNGQQAKLGLNGRGTVTQVCTFEGSLEDYLQLRSTDGSSSGEGLSSSASERGCSDDKAISAASSVDGATPARNVSEASRQSSQPAAAEGGDLDAASAGCLEDGERQPSAQSSTGAAASTRERSDASQGSLPEVADESAAGSEETAPAEEPREDAAKPKTGRLIELEMKDGCVVWPTDRPVIPLPLWQLTSFSHEPLTAEQWAQLPTVGTAGPYSQLLEAPLAALSPAEIRHAYVPGLLSRLRGMSSTPMPQPVALPPLKLPVGCEAPPLSVQIGTVQSIPSAAEKSGQSTRQISGAANQPRRSNSFSSGPVFPSLNNQATGGSRGVMYANFSNKHFIQHVPTGAEGEVLRTEDDGASLIVRIKNGRVKKFARSDCRVTKAVCTPTKAPSERQLTAAAHHHALAMLISRANRAQQEAAALPLGLQKNNASLGAKPEQQNATVSNTTQLLPPCLGPRSKSLLSLFSFGKTDVAEAPTIAAQSQGKNLSINPALRGADQIPKIDDLVKIAQEHAINTATNTLCIAGPTSEPSIREIGSHVAVEAVRTKKYVLDDGEEGSMVPVFSSESQALQAREAEEARRRQQQQAALPLDPTQILLERHRELEELKRQQLNAQEDEIIYAQDAPDATRAPGIVSPTVIKETLVVPPKDSDNTRHLVRAPGIVHPLVEDAPDLEIIRPAASQAPGSQMPSNSYAAEETAGGVEWYAGLQQQMRAQLMQHYAQTGDLQAATAALTGAGIPLPASCVPFPFNMGAPNVQRRQAKVLRDEADQIQFAPIA